MVIMRTSLFVQIIIMKHLSKDERNEIQILYEKKYSLRRIARVMERNVSTISRELKRNKVKWKYTAKKANHKAYQRRRTRKIQMKKIRINDELEQYIHTHLKERWTPKLIAGAWNRQCEEKGRESETIHYMTIYRYVYSRFWTDLWQYLYSKRYRPKKRRKNKKTKKQLIPYRVRIDARPQSISKLLEFGHYEADLFVGPQWTKPVVLTLTEKVSRMKLAYWLPNKKPLWVQKKLQQIIEEYGIKSITFDNWVEFMYHYKLGIPTYFCHPYHSREKGQVEYTNKLYRIFIPKWTDLSNIDQEGLDLITKNLNNRPMVCLDYDVPINVFRSYLPSVAIAL